MTVRWDPRWMDRERAMTLVGGWELLAGVDTRGDIRLTCCEAPYATVNPGYYCGQQLIPAGRTFTLEELLEAVLRHAVAAHALDTGHRHQGGPDGREAADPAGVHRGAGRRGEPAGHLDRHVDQTPDPRGGRPDPGGARR